MWMRNPGKNSPRFVLTLMLALAVLTGGPVLAKDQGKSPAPAVTTPEPEISFNGKVFCSLKRRVDLPFKALITSVLVHSGERVTAGQVLARFRLAPESVPLIRNRLFPPQIYEGKIKLTELDRSLADLNAKRAELAKLSAKNLASVKSLETVSHDLSLLTQERGQVQDELLRSQQLALEDRLVLQSQLGSDLKSGKIPREAALVAPIAGYVIWIHPELREGALLDPTPGVFQIGVMDPMVVRADAFEIEALQIKTGETAEVTLESLPGRKFKGQVSRISWSSTTPGLQQPSYYDVELKVANPDLLLKDGLKAQIVFPKAQ